MIAGLALAGGAARRMGGGDKPLLAVAGRPMLAHVLEALAAEAAHVAISANGDPARFAAFGRPVLNDGAFFGLGPLAGVLAGLEWANELGATALLTLPGDVPFPPVGLGAALSPAPACAASEGRRQHLVALWPVDAAAALRAFLTVPGRHAVQAFAALIDMREVGFGDSFLNVNTPEDLAAVRALDG